MVSFALKNIFSAPKEMERIEKISIAIDDKKKILYFWARLI